MGVFVDLTGRVFGRLTVVHRAPNHAGRVSWGCMCSCGNTHIATGNALSTGHAKSCGCRRSEATTERNTTHGLSGHELHWVWLAIRKRCLSKRCTDYNNYGGRGITMSAEWVDSFAQFVADMGPRPTPKHSVERKDNAQGYSKDNCVWATQDEQARNTRRTYNITYLGKTLCLSDWAATVGMNASTFTMRLKRGWSMERALNKPVAHMGRYYE